MRCATKRTATPCRTAPDLTITFRLNMQTLPGESDQLPTPPAEDPEGAPEDQTSAKAMPSWLHRIS